MKRPPLLFRSLLLSATATLFLCAATIPSAGQDRWRQLPGPYKGITHSHLIDTVTGDIYITMANYGIYRSSDQGESWGLLKGENGMPDPQGTAVIRENSRLWALPIGDVVMRLFRSDDNGRTWRNVLDRLEWISGKASSIAFDLPFIIVGTEGVGGSGGGAFISTDSGRTFTPDAVSNKLTGACRFFNYGDDIGGIDDYRFYLTSDRGATWRLMNEPLNLKYPRRIVAVIDRTVVWQGAEGGFYRTDDSGRTVVEIRAKGSGSMHAQGRTLYCYDPVEGALRSDDLGATWETLPVFPPFFFTRFFLLPSGEYIVSLAINSLGAVVEGFHKSRNGGTEWVQVGGDQDGVVDLAFSGDTIYAIAHRNAWRNVGQSNQWELMTYGRNQTIDILSSDGGDTLWLLDYRNFSRSDNRGAIWEPLQLTSNVNDTVALVNHGGVLYDAVGDLEFPPRVGKDQRRLNVSTNQGLSWLPRYDSSRIFWAMLSENVEPFGGSLYVRARRRADTLPALFRSDDDGLHWTLVDSTLPDHPVTAGDPLPLQAYGDRLVTRYDRNSFAVYIRTDPSDPTALRREIIAHIKSTQTMTTFAYHEGYYYAAIGRNFYHFPAEESQHVGMVRTNDNGATWHPFNTEHHKPHQGTKLYHHGGDLFMLDIQNIYTLAGRGRYRLTILNGYGSGYYDAGDTVHIWSRALSPIEVFDAWEAPVAPNDTLLPLRGDEWHTTLVMPAANVTLTAAIDTLAETTFLSDTLELEIHTIPVRYALPPQAKGVILLFHDQQGGASDWLTETENHQFVRDALHAGFALIAIDAIRTEDKGPYWNGDPPDLTNIDIDRIVGALGELVQRSPSLDGLPFYSVGVGNGGDFAAALSGALGHRAAGLYVAGGSPEVVTRFDLPIIFSITEHDRPGEPTRTAAENHSGSLALRGIATELAVNAASPLYAERFARIPGIDTALSRLLVEEIAAGGHLDARRHLRTHPDALVAAAAADPTTYPLLSTLPPPLDHDLLMQLKAVYSAPVFFSDLNKNTLRFFCDLLPSSVLSAASHGRAAILAVAVDNGVSVRYRLAEAGAVEIRLFDLLGRAVATLYEGTSGKGENVATSTHVVPSGGYLLRMETADGEVVTRYVSVVR